MSEPRVFIPWMHAVGDDYDSEGVWVTASEVRDVLTTSHMHCGWEVSRGGEVQLCRKTAVAIRYDEEHGVLGEVCKAHAARVLVPLSFIAQVAAEVRSTDTTGAGVESLPAPCSDECGWCGENMPPTTDERGE